MKLTKPNAIDPLYTIFEQHLYNFQDSDLDRKTFIDQVVSDYLSYLRKKQIAVPLSLQNIIAEELSDQVNAMLVKKIYGNLTIRDFRKRVPMTQRRQARVKYAKLSRG